MKILTLLALGVIVLLSSCGDSKKLQYLQGPLADSVYRVVHYKEPVIQPGDVLAITVYSDNPAASAIYNQPSVAGAAPSSSAGTGAPTNSGYLVDQRGNIQFHSIGTVYARGRTRQELGAILASKLDSVLMHPYCLVRFNNFKVTVIGEVNNPSVFPIASEKISVLEAIGLSGDLTPYGRRDSIMVIRETDSLRRFGWIDLRKTDIFNSEFFYLQQNDVVVVHPTKKKAAASDVVTTRNISLAATIVSTLAVVYSLIIINN